MENFATYNDIDLISRYFNAEADEREIALLSEMLSTKPEKLDDFNAYLQTWQKLEKEKIEKTIDIEDEWNKISIKTVKVQKDTKIIPLVQSRKNAILFKVMKYAAVLIVLAVSVGFLYYYFSKPQTKQLIAKTNAVEGILPDGSSVTLNEGSMLEYPGRFEKNNRKVVLKGEAYFNVKPDVSKPFIISADNIIIEVLGTSFYVNSENTNGKVEVILTTGKVAVYHKDKPDEKVILEPGEKVEMSKNFEETNKTINEDENYLAWKTKKLVFNDEPLEKIAKTLNKLYHSKINTDHHIANCKITATFENQTLDAILHVIEATVDVKITRSDDVIQISGAGCK